MKKRQDHRLCPGLYPLSAHAPSSPGEGHGLRGIDSATLATVKAEEEATRGGIQRIYLPILAS
jgi:hypothetical protein